MSTSASAIRWIRNADYVTLIGETPKSGEAVHVTVIVSGPPPTVGEPNQTGAV